MTTLISRVVLTLTSLWNWHSKAWSLDGYTIIAGREISQAEFSALVTLRPPFD